MSEGEGGTRLLQVGPAVAHEDALLIFLVDNFLSLAPCAGEGIQGVCAHVRKACRPGEGELAAGVDVAHKNGRQCAARLAAQEPSLHDGGHLLRPGHRHGVARDVDVDGILVRLRQSGNELVLVVGQLHLLAVVPLAVLIVGLVEPAEDDDVVGSPGFLHGFADELVGGALVLKVLTRGDTVVAAAHVAHIAAGIVHLHLALQTVFQALQGRYLVLCLQAAGASAHGHHLDGILAHHEDALGLCGPDG